MFAIRSRRLSKLNFGNFNLRKFLSTADTHYDLSSTKNAYYRNTEAYLLKKFESSNSFAVRRTEESIFLSISAASAEHSNPHTCGQYQYFSSSSNPGDPQSSYVIFRQLKVTGLSNDNDSSFQRGTIPVLDIDHLMTVVPNMDTVSRMKPSLDHNMIAFAVDLQGEDATLRSLGKEKVRTTFFIKDIRKNIICELDISKAISNAEIRLSIVDFEWSISSTGNTILYLVFNDCLHRPCLVSQLDMSKLSGKMFSSSTDNNAHVTSMRIFAPKIADMKEIFYEDNKAFNVDVRRSKDDKYVIISSHSKTSSQVAVAPVPLSLSLIDPTPTPTHSAFNGFTTILQRQVGLKYYVDHCNESFYVATNMLRGAHSSTAPLHHLDEDERAGTGDLLLIRYPSAQLSKFSAPNGINGSRPSNFNGWEILFPNSADGVNGNHGGGAVSMRDFDIFQNKIVIYGTRKGYPTVQMLDLSPLSGHRGQNDNDNDNGSRMRGSVMDLTTLIRADVGSDMFSVRTEVETDIHSDTSHFTVSSPLVPGTVTAPPTHRYHIISYHIISYHIISYHTVSCHTVSYHIISYHIMSCLAFPCLERWHALPLCCATTDALTYMTTFIPFTVYS